LVYLNIPASSSSSSNIIAVTHQAVFHIGLISSAEYIIHNPFFVTKPILSQSLTDTTHIIFSPGCNFIIFHPFLNFFNSSVSIFFIEFLFVSKIKYLPI
jgi:hypothetical protein